MNYRVHFYLSPEGYTCEVQHLENRDSAGPALARGTGPTKDNARDATLAVVTDAEVRRVLIDCVPEK